MRRTALKRTGNGLRRKSKKREAQERSPEGQSDLAYMGDVRSLPCCICGTMRNVKAHHCKDHPPFNLRKIYTRLPAAGRKSGARDTIPLCEPGCHKDSGWGYHDGRKSWNERNGPDWTYIERTRILVDELRASIDF